MCSVLLQPLLLLVQLTKINIYRVGKLKLLHDAYFGAKARQTKNEFQSGFSEWVWD